MKRVTIITALLLAIALPSSVVRAQNNGSNNNATPQMNMMQGQGMMNMMQGNKMNGMRGNMMDMMSMMRNRMQSMMNNPRMRMRMSVYVLPSLDVLGLKDEQKTKLNKLKSDYIANNKETRTKIRNFQKQLNTELSAKSLNITKVRKQVKDKAKAQGDLQLSFIETYYNMLNVLTPDQKNKLQNMNTQSFMTAMMNSIPMGQMMALCPMNGSGNNGMMSGHGMMGGRGMMNNGNSNSMMN